MKETIDKGKELKVVYTPNLFAAFQKAGIKCLIRVFKIKSPSHKYELVIDYEDSTCFKKTSKMMYRDKSALLSGIRIFFLQKEISVLFNLDELNNCLDEQNDYIDSAIGEDREVSIFGGRDLLNARWNCACYSHNLPTFVSFDAAEELIKQSCIVREKYNYRSDLRIYQLLWTVLEISSKRSFIRNIGYLIKYKDIDSAQKSDRVARRFLVKFFKKLKLNQALIDGYL